MQSNKEHSAQLSSKKLKSGLWLCHCYTGHPKVTAKAIGQTRESAERRCVRKARDALSAFRAEHELFCDTLFRGIHKAETELYQSPKLRGIRKV